VHGQKFQRLVAHDHESSVRDVAEVYGACSGRKLDLLAVGRFHGGSFEHVECLLAVMDMSRDTFTRLEFGDGEDDLHFRPGQINPFQSFRLLASCACARQTKAVAATVAAIHLAATTI
jgi:hypothetical protein